MDITEKACTACLTVLPLEAFAPSAKGRGGRNGQCRKCCGAIAARNRKLYPEQAKARDARSHAKRDPAVVARQSRERIDKDREANREYQRQRGKLPHVRDAARLRVRKWTAENLPRKLADNQTRLKRVRQAMPPWVDREEIIAIYLGRPPGCEVDHIIPLVGRTPEGWRVSGLHVPWNLQYLPKMENRTKHARVLEPVNE
jgi:hypothetical protein